MDAGSIHWDNTGGKMPGDICVEVRPGLERDMDCIHEQGVSEASGKKELMGE